MVFYFFLQNVLIFSLKTLSFGVSAEHMVPRILDSGSPLCIGIHPTSIPWNIGIKGKLPLNKVYNGWTIYKNMPSFQVNISSATVHTMTTQYTHLGVTTCLYMFIYILLAKSTEKAILVFPFITIPTFISPKFVHTSLYIKSNALKVHVLIFQNLVFWFIWRIITPKM